MSFSFPVILNAVFVGAELTYYLGDPFYLNALWVAIGEVTVCYGLGVPLFLGVRGALAKGKAIQNPDP